MNTAKNGKRLIESHKRNICGDDPSPDSFGGNEGNLIKDNPLNQDGIGEKEILVVSFGTSFNDSRIADIKGIEDAMQALNPGWSVRRAFSSQIIINHILTRDREKIDNMEEAFERAVANDVKKLVIQPTLLIQGTEYDELVRIAELHAPSFENILLAEPLLGLVGDSASSLNPDKAIVAREITKEAVKEAGFSSLSEAKTKGTAFVFMGHGTSHPAKISYIQMVSQMEELGYDNVFVGTVEGEPEETACKVVIEDVKRAGYKKVVLRPLMLVAGDHANNDMAGDDKDSWKSLFGMSGAFDSIVCQTAGLGRIPSIQKLYVEHTKAACRRITSENTLSD
ncbi:MAG: sirohydrochlorin cobaltochelatase [Treponemataceae bacterium]|nr:sirohydrochlorin cobaltochelatase [Treponemataceae bacterium]